MTRRRLISCLAPILFATAGPCAAAADGFDPASNAYGASASLPPALVQQVSDFLDHFVDPGKTAEEQVALFTDHAEYFGQGPINRDAMLKDAQRYRRQWPSRSYHVTRIDFIFPDPALGARRVYVRFEVDFKVENRRRWVAGRGMYGAVIVDVDAAPRIVSIMESVVERRSGKTAAD